MGFSEHDVPDADVTFGFVKQVEPNTKERPLTAAEQEDIEAVAEAVKVWEKAWDEVPNLVKTKKSTVAVGQK